MIQLTGNYNTAKVFNNKLDEATVTGILSILNQEYLQNSSIRIMPDCHAGMGCVIGTTLTIPEKKVCPNFVGVDIGCGILCLKLAEKDIDLHELDEVINAYVPAGFNTNIEPHPFIDKVSLANLTCIESIKNMSRAHLSIGTLGGGNHFIELAKAQDGGLYLVIHTGSRSLGHQVATYYQEQAYRQMQQGGISKRDVIDRLKKEGRESEIQQALAKVPVINVDKQTAYVSGELFYDYINDIKVSQEYAKINREAIAHTIFTEMKWQPPDYTILSVHNYIDTENMILRKGAISAQANEMIIMPFNMRDGSLIGKGKGNADWNYSAPHGAGRTMSRTAARGQISMLEYSNAMQGIHSSSVCESTIDEAPMAYKSMNEIISYIGETVEIVSMIKPVYNFKAR